MIDPDGLSNFHIWLELTVKAHYTYWYLTFCCSCLAAHTDCIHCVNKHPSDENLFLTAGQDGHVILWDQRKPKPASRLGNSLISISLCQLLLFCNNEENMCISFLKALVFLFECWIIFNYCFWNITLWVVLLYNPSWLSLRYHGTCVYLYKVWSLVERLRIHV